MKSEERTFEYYIFFRYNPTQRLPRKCSFCIYIINHIWRLCQWMCFILNSGFSTIFVNQIIYNSRGYIISKFCEYFCLKSTYIYNLYILQYNVTPDCRFQKVESGIRLTNTYSVKIDMRHTSAILYLKTYKTNELHQIAHDVFLCFG